MDIERAQTRINDQVQEEITRRYGQAFYDAVLEGQVLSGIESWFAPFLQAAGKRRKDKDQPCRSPMEVAAKIAERSRPFVASPSLQVQCGHGLMCAALDLDHGIDEDERAIALAGAAFGPERFRRQSLLEFDPRPQFKTIVVVEALGNEAMKQRQIPVFRNFFKEADRRLIDKGHLIVVEQDRFQDNIIEPLVGMDYEIQDVMSIKPSGLTLVITEK